MSRANIIKLVVAGIAAIFLLVLCFTLFNVVTVKGNQIGVKETWSDGVVETPLPPATYFLFPAWSQKVYLYDLSSQVFTMNNTPTKHEPKYKGREVDSYHVQSAEGQDMEISLNVRWHLDPTKVIGLHKTIGWLSREDFEEKLIRTEVMRIVKNEATMRKAIDAFSGEGLVKLQNDIQKDLCAPNGEMAQRGIIVENFVIEKIGLDEKYIGEIRSRQIATQAKLRADEETKASQAQALKAQADAKADYNKRVVEAERDKQVGILKAEENAQKQVLGAEAEKKQNVLKAEGDRDSGKLRAEAIEAIGKAESDVIKMKMTAYSVPGSENFVKMEIAKSMGVAFSGLKGWLPGDMKVNVLTSDFLQALGGFMPQARPTPKAQQ